MGATEGPSLYEMLTSNLTAARVSQKFFIDDLNLKPLGADIIVANQKRASLL